MYFVEVNMFSLKRLYIFISSAFDYVFDTYPFEIGGPNSRFNALYSLQIISIGNWWMSQCASSYFIFTSVSSPTTAIHMCFSHHKVITNYTEYIF